MKKLPQQKQNKQKQQKEIAQIVEKKEIITKKDMENLGVSSMNSNKDSPYKANYLKIARQ